MLNKLQISHPYSPNSEKNINKKSEQNKPQKFSPLHSVPVSVLAILIKANNKPVASAVMLMAFREYFAFATKIV